MTKQTVTHSLSSPIINPRKHKHKTATFCSVLFCSVPTRNKPIPTLFSSKPNQTKPSSPTPPIMRTIMSRSPHDASFSFSRRHFKWLSKPESSDDAKDLQSKRKVGVRIRSAIVGVVMGRGKGPGLGSRVTGTLFGRRRGHVRIAFQVDPNTPAVAVVELATNTSGLVKEMASGLVRIALECDKKDKKVVPSVKILEEPFWRTYCNGKKCGYAVRRNCSPSDLNVLRTLESVSMGAGVLPCNKTDEADDGEMMYMRARFERVVGSKDSEAFYMMNPDGNGGPELSIYFLRL